MQQEINDLWQNRTIDLERLEVIEKSRLNLVLNYQNKQTGDNLLIYAARSGNLNLIKLLNENSLYKNMSFTNKDGKNALHEACQNGHFDCVRYLVESAKIDVNSLRKGDWTPLMLACTRDNRDIIEYLLEKGADLEQRNKDGWNAFQIAVREGHEDIVELLLRKKASKLVRTRNGRTPAHTAALHGHLNVLKLLLIDQSNSVLNSRDNCGSTPFMEAIIADHLDIIKYLLEAHNKEVNIHDRDNLGNSSIHLVSQSGSKRTCEYLFDVYYGSGFDSQSSLIDRLSNDLNEFKMTPLHIACKNNKIDIVEFILNKIGRENESIRRLLEQKDSHGRSAVDIANFNDIERLFLTILNQ